MIEKKKILVIEDERDMVEELTIRLEASGWEVSAAYDGQEGIERAKKEKPDLILLDIIIPKLNGYEVCLELKKDLQTKPIPIIMLSAHAQESDRHRGQEAGADDYITKPYTMDLLLQKIRWLLGEKI